MLPNPSNISHILKMSHYNYPATSSSSSAKEDLPNRPSKSHKEY
jgi:hypothetical protein